MDEDELSDLEAQALIRETEAEIFRDANGTDPPEDGPFSADVIADQSRVEGWQGHLDDLELIETTRFPHGSQPGWDRPLAYRDEMDAVSQNEQLRQELAQRDAQIQQLIDGTGPVREAREQQQQARRDALLNASMDPQQADQVLGMLEGQQQQIHANNMARANASLEAAHHAYGPDFERVYSAVQAAAQTRSPVVQQIVQTILSSDDPGEQLMALSDSDLVRSYEGRNSGAPFMPRSNTAQPQRNWGAESDADSVGRQLEAHIFDAAWED